MWDILINSTLAGVLAAAVATDHRTRRIPNMLTLPAIAAGVALNGMEAGVPGAGLALWGAAVGAGVFFLPFILGGIGGGDMKLMTAVGALKGPSFVFTAFLCAAIVGGLVALARLARGREERRLAWARMRSSVMLAAVGVAPDSETAAGFPYAVCIAVGTAAAFAVSPQLGF